jgi:cytosine/adenosine deaminase-related metal-dependent hydrolase
VVIRASDLNMQPVHDPVSSVVFQASLANIDSVMVAGRWKKRALVDDDARQPGGQRRLAAEVSSDRKACR